MEFFGRREIRDMFAEVFSYDRELIEKGIEQGIEQGIIKIAKNLLNSGMSIEEVVDYSELSIEVVKSLA